VRSTPRSEISSSLRDFRVPKLLDIARRAC
jgi:hypothetical protein